MPKPSAYTYRLGINLVIAALTTSPAAARDLETIREQVNKNFDRIKTLYAVIDVEVPSMSDGDDPASLVHKISEWAFDEQGRVRHGHNYIFPENYTASKSKDTLNVHDGKLGRGVRFDAQGLQIGGGIFSKDDYYDHFIRFPAGDAQLGRAYGTSLGGSESKSLPEWLALPNAQYLGTETIDGVECDVVQFSRDFYALAIEYGHTLMRWENKNHEDDVSFRVQNESFVEVESGLWLPTKGTVTLPNAVYEGRKIRPVGYEVLELKVNEELPDELFQLEFDDGIRIVDRRFRTNFDQRVVLNDLKQDIDRAIIEPPTRDQNPTPTKSPDTETTTDPLEHSHPPPANPTNPIALGVGLIVCALVLLACLYSTRKRISRNQTRPPL